MAFYHISPKTGRPARCAGPERCKFGGGEQNPHFGTQDEANAHVAAQARAEAGSDLLPTIKRDGPSAIREKRFRTSGNKALEEVKALANLDIPRWAGQPMGGKVKAIESALESGDREALIAAVNDAEALAREWDVNLAIAAERNYTPAANQITAILDGAHELREISERLTGPQDRFRS